ncbi:MAG: hypothetical protein ACTSRP_06635 [Candidatus Helarchaeota archaeon]
MNKGKIKNLLLLTILCIVIIAGIIIVPIVLFKLNQEEKMPEGGPYYHQIYSAYSSDGLNWTVNKTLIFDHASVPGAVYFNGKIYLYFVNAESGEKLSVAISQNNGSTFKVYNVIINGTHSPRPVDPAPMVDNGKIRLTYLGNLMCGSTNNIVTATSSDGINFNEEGIIYSGSEITDPDLFKNSTGGWVLFVNRGPNLIKATSPTITNNFTTDNSFNFTGGWLASTHYINGKNYTYLHNGKNISVAEYNSSGLTILAENLISGFRGIVGDPTVAVLGPNKYIMYFKTCITC